LVAGGNLAGFGNPSSQTTEVYDPATGNWSRVADMLYPRQNHFAILLPSGPYAGDVLVGSGTSQDGTLLRSTELYDYRTNTWTQSGDMLEPQLSVTPVMLPNGQVLVVGGDDAWAWQKAEEYDPQTGTWHAVTNMPLVRLYTTVTLLNNDQVLVAGGDDYRPSIGNQNKLYCLIYDPQTNTWSQVALLNNAHLYPTAVLLPSGKVLLTGGYDYTDPNLADPMDGIYTKGSEIFQPPTRGVANNFLFLPGVLKTK
jgi:hypothetical protein